MEKIVKLLEENARYTNEEIAVMLGITTEEVAKKIRALEEKGVIKGYKAIINRELLSDDYVCAIIELNVSPKRDLGFDEVAETISGYPEVEDLYLMSGGYDLALTVSGKSFKDIALFVSQRLAPLDSVLSTSTHFILSSYKEKGVIMHGIMPEDERGNACL